MTEMKLGTSLGSSERQKLLTAASTRILGCGAPNNRNDPKSRGDDAARIIKSLHPERGVEDEGRITNGSTRELA